MGCDNKCAICVHIAHAALYIRMGARHAPCDKYYCADHVTSGLSEAPNPSGGSWSGQCNAMSGTRNKFCAAKCRKFYLPIFSCQEAALIHVAAIIILKVTHAGKNE